MTNLATIPTDPTRRHRCQTKSSCQAHSNDVTIEVDANGRSYNGTVNSIAGASGARFSLLPPENATGNYVKVVQRIPVKIVLDPDQNKDQSLRPGMSVDPKVWIRQ